MQRTLVLGGTRSGKSAIAEGLVAQAAPACYIATATAGDEEMAERIRQHRRRRPASWALLEEPVALARALDQQAPGGATLLIDCMSLWLSNLLAEGESSLVRERDAFLDALERYPADAVIVSNEVGLGLIGMDPLTRRFADELGWLNQALAQRCDRVILAVAGLPHTIKNDRSEVSAP